MARGRRGAVVELLPLRVGRRQRVVSVVAVVVGGALLLDILFGMAFLFCRLVLERVWTIGPWTRVSELFKLCFVPQTVLPRRCLLLDL